MTTFTIYTYGEHSHWIEYRLPWSDIVHNVGTIGFDSIHEVTMDIRIQFAMYLAASLGEITGCSEDQIVSDSCKRMYEYWINRLSFQGRLINFYDGLDQMIKCHNHIKSRITDQRTRDWFESVHDWCITFQLHWKDHHKNLLPREFFSKAA